MAKAQRIPRTIETSRRATNESAWAIGYDTLRGFSIRRIVWGRTLAREEKRDGETIRRATLLLIT